MMMVRIMFIRLLSIFIVILFVSACAQDYNSRYNISISDSEEDSVPDVTINDKSKIKNDDSVDLDIDVSDDKGENISEDEDEAKDENELAHEDEAEGEEDSLADYEEVTLYSLESDENRKIIKTIIDQEISADNNDRNYVMHTILSGLEAISNSSDNYKRHISGLHLSNTFLTTTYGEFLENKDKYTECLASVEIIIHSKQFIDLKKVLKKYNINTNNSPNNICSSLSKGQYYLTKNTIGMTSYKEYLVDIIYNNLLLELSALVDLKS